MSKKYFSIKNLENIASKKGESCWFIQSRDSLQWLEDSPMKKQHDKEDTDHSEQDQ